MTKISLTIKWWHVAVLVGGYFVAKHFGLI